jgi:flagellar protein FlaG
MDINDVSSRVSTAFAAFPPRQQRSAGSSASDAQVVSEMHHPTDIAAGAAGAASSRAIQTQSVLVEEASAREDAKPDGLQEAVEKVQKFVSMTACDIKFSIDEDSGQTVVKVVDRETKDVIRQIPSEEMLDLAQALDKLQGLLIKQKA